MASLDLLYSSFLHHNSIASSNFSHAAKVKESVGEGKLYNVYAKEAHKHRLLANFFAKKAIKAYPSRRGSRQYIKMEEHLKYQPVHPNR